MNLKNGNITVNYQTRNDYCGSCNRPIENAELSTVKEFDVSLHDIFHWTEWKFHLENENEIRDLAEECIYNMISFYSVNSHQTIYLCKGETDKVVQVILNKFKIK